MEIKSIYRMRGPNEPILLYDGQILIRQRDATYSIEKAQIEAMWPPTQHCVIKLRENEGLDEGKALLDIPSLQISGIPVEVFKAIYERGYRVLFKAKQFFTVSGSKDCDAIVVHIPNFFDTGLHLKTSEWDIKIEPVWNIKDSIRVMSLQSGFALTHLCIIKKSGNSRFNLDQAGRMLRALESYISFMRGAWCGLFLPIGFLEENISWYYWDLPMVMPWRTKPNYWSTIFDFSELNKSFDKFINLPEYHSLVNVISFYTGANALEAPDIAVVMTQIALEILVSLYVSTGKFKEDKHEKIRRLLREKHISPEIPTELKELYEYCQNNIKDGSPLDGPSAITYLRNYFVHPRKENIEKIVEVPVSIMGQVTSLGLAYIELIILNVFGYKGPYTDRFTGNTKSTAWSISPDAIQSVVNKSST